MAYQCFLILNEAYSRINAYNYHQFFRDFSTIKWECYLIVIYSHTGILNESNYLSTIVQYCTEIICVTGSPTYSNISCCYRVFRLFAARIASSEIVVLLEVSAKDQVELVSD